MDLGSDVSNRTGSSNIQKMGKGIPSVKMTFVHIGNISAVTDPILTKL